MTSTGGGALDGDTLDDDALETWDDASLVGRSTSGDDLAFAVLVRRYEAPIFRHTLRLTRDRRAAEDVAQETFVTAWRRLPTLTRAEAFRSWLYQIATRRSIDVVRARQPEQPLDGLGTVVEPVASEPGPEEHHERRAQLEHLSTVLAELPLVQRAAWSLREIDDLSYDEIAVVLGVPVSTVRGRIARARHELAERMRAWQTTRD